MMSDLWSMRDWQRWFVTSGALGPVESGTDDDVIGEEDPCCHIKTGIQGKG
jgi:hypothetical protein